VLLEKIGKENKKQAESGAVSELHHSRNPGLESRTGDGLP